MKEIGEKKSKEAATAQQANTVKERTESDDSTNPWEDTPFIEERFEIIDNVRYDLKPSPTVKHQRLLIYFGQAIYTTCHIGAVFLYFGRFGSNFRAASLRTERFSNLAKYKRLTE